jgi:endo-1,4-beta-xylanase
MRPRFALPEKGSNSQVEKYNTSGKSTDGKLLNTVNIHNPTIEVHLAPADQAEYRGGRDCRAGGGTRYCGWDRKGTISCRSLRRTEVSTIVLRNRLRIDGYERLRTRSTTPSRRSASSAVRAAEWKIDPAKIGIIGFSAGAELSAPTRFSSTIRSRKIQRHRTHWAKFLPRTRLRWA